MGSLRFTDIQSRPTEVLDVTRLTVDEFRQVVPPFEATFQAHMAQWRLDGQPRTTRRYTTDQNCPRPTPEERRLCILVYLKTYPLQVVQGRLFGMGQSKAHQWIHVLLVVLQATWRTLGDTPARSLTELAKRLGVAVAEATALALPPEQTRCDRGKKTCHTVKNVLLINAALPIFFRSDTYADSTHDKRIAEASPDPLPAGSRLLQDLGFLAFTLDRVEILMPTRKPRGRNLTRAQKAANRRIARRRVRLEHVNSRVKV
ncbi:MAG TPA: transposase family protein, partial [Candidatus Binatia bacterium]|nr:transposase family protein [Candidatus Binatia bacterium]